MAALIALTARWSFRVGVLVALDGQRKKVERQARGDGVPEIFKLEEDRTRSALLARARERGGILPQNFRRPGMTEAEREAISYQLETGKLDKAIDKVVEEELEQS
jgi:hypothetical protein